MTDEQEAFAADGQPTAGVLPAADEAAYEEVYYEDEDEDERRRRMHRMLAIVLAMLVLLLIALGVFIVKALTPAGAAHKKDAGYTWIRSIYGWGKADTEQLRAPTDAAIGPDGTIYATYIPGGAVIAFKPDGTFVRRIQLAKGAMRPEGIAVGENGEVYVADFQYNRVVVFSSGGTLLRQWQIPVPTEIAVRGGRVVVASVYGIAYFDEKGTLLKLIGTRGKGAQQFDTPHGLAIAANGDVYVSDTNNARVKAYSRSGRLLWVAPVSRTTVKALKSPSSTVSGPFKLPAGMTLDGKGRIVLVDSFDFTIDVLDPARKGRIVATYGGYGQTDGLFAYPTGISYDAKRDVFCVADTANDRLQVIHIPGTGNAAAGALRRLFDGPVWVCAVPLILLLIALAVAISRRRREREDEDADESEAAGLRDEAHVVPGEDGSTD